MIRFKKAEYVTEMDGTTAKCPYLGCGWDSGPKDYASWATAEYHKHFETDHMNEES